MVIFFPPTANHLHQLQVDNCDSNSRLVVYEDDNGKFRLERVLNIPTVTLKLWKSDFVAGFLSVLSSFVTIMVESYIYYMVMSSVRFH